MGGCSVEGCKNRFEKGKKHFYRYPRDFKREIWARFTRKGKDFVPKESNVICEDHFEERFLVPKKKRLMLDKDAVPTVYWRLMKCGILAEKVLLQYDGSNYTGEEADRLDELAIQNEEDKANKIESVATEKRIKFDELKIVCRFCAEISDIRIEFKSFESYNINIQQFMAHIELNTNLDDYLSNVVCEECFNQVVALETFSIKCKNSEQKYITTLEECDLKISTVKQVISESQETAVFVRSIQEGLDYKVEYLDNELDNDIEDYSESNMIMYDYGDDNLLEHQQEIQGNSFELMSVDQTIIENLDPIDEIISTAIIKNEPGQNQFSIRQYDCMFCKNIFYGMKTFKNHKCQVKEINCPKCPKIFTKLHSYRAHESQAHGGPTISKHFCPICKTVVIGSVNRFTRHKRTCNKNKQHEIECEICKKMLPTLTGYTIHKMFHENGRNYTHKKDDKTKDDADCKSKRESTNNATICHICGKIFQTASGLRIHRKSAHDNSGEIYQCEKCSKICSNVLALKDHIRNSHKIQETPCNICGKIFRTKNLLQKHKRYHDETKRSYKCLLCAENPGYFTNAALKRHQRSHFGDRPYACDHCDIAYTTNQQLKLHIANKHKDPEQITIINELY